jgi:hypothetical protein
MAYTHYDGISYKTKLAKGEQNSEVEIKPVSGIADGYKIGRGPSSISGGSNVVTGLTTVVSVVASLGQIPDSNAATVTAEIGAIAGTVDLIVWKLAEGAPNILVPSTIARTVHWIAIGT